MWTVRGALIESYRRPASVRMRARTVHASTPHPVEVRSMSRFRRLRPGIVLTAAALATACHRNRTPAAQPAPVANDADAARRDSVARAEADRRAAEDRARAERDRLDRERAAARDAVMRTLQAPIYFDYDRSDLSAETRGRLDEKLAILGQQQGLMIRVIGHADDRGSDEYNMALGQRRAAAARRYLTQHGIDGSRVSTVSFGEERPACEGTDEACRSQNRRDEFEITGGAVALGE